MRTARLLVPVAALGALVAVDLFTPVDTGLVEAPAHAVIGRPLTPMSYAGVARRTTRRMAVVMAAAPAPADVRMAEAPAALPATARAR
jgi:hypothetical protein